MPATVTFYREHRRTLCCLPGIVSLVIMCVGIISHNYFYVGRHASPGRSSNWTPDQRHTVCVTLYCTWRPSGLATGLHGQGFRNVVSGMSCWCCSSVARQRVDACASCGWREFADCLVILAARYCVDRLLDNRLVIFAISRENDIIIVSQLTRVVLRWRVVHALTESRGTRWCCGSTQLSVMMMLLLPCAGSGHNAPLLHLLILALCIAYAFSHRMLLHLSFFFTLPCVSFPLRIDPLHLQAGGHKRRPNLGFF